MKCLGIIEKKEMTWGIAGRKNKRYSSRNNDGKTICSIASTLYDIESYKLVLIQLFDDYDQKLIFEENSNVRVRLNFKGLI